MSFRLLAITQAPDDPATRYRLRQYLPHFEKAGVEVTAVPWPRPPAGREGVCRRAGEYDAVVVVRRLVPVRYFDRLRAAARRLAFDFDDNIAYRDSFLGRPLLLLEKWVQFRRVVGFADAVTAGNAFLAERARRHVRGAEVRVAPTTVDPALYPWPPPHRDGDGELVLGWIGQKSTRKYLARLRRPLARVARMEPRAVLRIIGDELPTWPELRLQLDPWSTETEAADLALLDVGLAPLPDDVWTRGKCGLRVLQYFAAGVPAVVSPVGVQGEWAAEGLALAARTGEEWCDTVRRLARDSSLRERLIAAGRRAVEQRFHPGATFPTILEAWCGIRAD